MEAKMATANIHTLKYQIVRSSENILKTERVIDMVYRTNECCDCQSEGYPCIGKLCHRRNALHLICDKCKRPSDELYYGQGNAELCAECALGELERVKAE